MSRIISLKPLLMTFAALVLLAGCSSAGYRTVYPLNQGVVADKPLSPEEVLEITDAAIKVSWMGYVFLMPGVQYELNSFCSKVDADVSDVASFMSANNLTRIKILKVDDRILGYSVGRVKVKYYPRQNLVTVERPQPVYVDGAWTWGEEPIAPGLGADY